MAYGSEWRRPFYGRRGARRDEEPRESARAWRGWNAGRSAWDAVRRGRGWPYGVGYEPGSEGDFGEWEDEPPPGRGPYGPPWFAEPGPAAPPSPPRRARRPGDGEVRENVHEALFHDSWVRPGGIDVDVSDGVVTLRGRVRDHMEARFVVDDAWDAPGVRGVINDLTVQGEDD